MTDPHGNQSTTPELILEELQQNQPQLIANTTIPPQDSQSLAISQEDFHRGSSSTTNNSATDVEEEERDVANTLLSIANLQQPPTAASTSRVLNVPFGPGGFWLLEEAMQLLEISEKKDYLEAIQRVPDLVHKESNPIKYLKFEKFNAWAAASRLARYWKKRMEVFGPERAFRSLTDFSGNGALNADDLILSIDGSTVFLPRDRFGRTVLLMSLDRGLNANRESLLRNIFLVAEMINQNENSCTEGYLALSIWQSQTPNQACMEVFALVRDIFPTKSTSSVLINKARGLQSIFPMIIRLAVAFFTRYARSHDLRFCSEPVETLRVLNEYGLALQDLPLELGGTLSFEQLIQWRRKLEDGTEESRLHSYQRFVVDCCRVLFTFAMDRPAFNVFKNAIPLEEKHAYNSATHRVGLEMVLQMTPPLLSFFRAEEFHAWRGAARVANFWKLKAELFTDEKLVKPVDQTGENALDHKDRAALKSGFVSLLPNDRRGRAVICIDLSRFPIESRRVERDRCIFYMFQVAAENESASIDGVVVLCVMDSDGSTNLDYLMLLSRISVSFPLHVTDLHLIWPGARPKSHVNIGSVEFRFAQRIYLHHCGESRDELAQTLSDFGLTAQLPRRLGGKWSLGQFAQWRELRTCLEWGVTVGYSGNNIDCGHEFCFPPQQPNASLSPEECRERERRKEVIRGRRKYDMEGGVLEKLVKKENLQLAMDDDCRFKQRRTR